ncbi:peroxidase 12-like protein [Tanacetum coccineum]
MQREHHISRALATINSSYDVSALSGGHTIGISHCTSFTPRLYPTQDPTMEKTFAHGLKEVCPTNTTDATTVMDILSPIKFDNKYFVDLMNRHGLFTRTQRFVTHKETKPIVNVVHMMRSCALRNFESHDQQMGQICAIYDHAMHVSISDARLGSRDVSSMMENMQRKPVAKRLRGILTLFIIFSAGSCDTLIGTHHEEQ